ncbi:clathrin assembly protein [Anaeramoeba flamelloides]|uniref:Clathrin assembly protein n=1 Tax=Anaeramoeba flamelloides TaxID=1746091 RepID=A0ABQ8ZA82_9EUKA|nr:clathrin assembly protein [Anaeramoeba flamelloides]
MYLKKWVKNKSSLVSANSELETRVVKATNFYFEEPKKKHVEYLIQQTRIVGAVNVQMSRFIGQRLQKKSYIVVLKSLLLLHNLMNQGHKNFITTFASKISNSSFFGLSHFKDLSTPKAFEYNEFIQQYAAYLEEKLVVFHAIRFSINHDIRQSDITSKYKLSGIPKIIKELPSFQQMLNLIIGCKFGKMFKDPLFNKAYYLLKQDSTNLSRIINDATSKILESFFKLDKSTAKSCYRIYRRHYKQSYRINRWLNINKSKYTISTEKEEKDNLKKNMKKMKIKMKKYLKTAKEKVDMDKNTNEISQGSEEEEEEESGSDSEGTEIKKKEIKEKIIINPNIGQDNSQPNQNEIKVFEKNNNTNKNDNLTLGINNNQISFINNSETNNQYVDSNNFNYNNNLNSNNNNLGGNNNNFLGNVNNNNNNINTNFSNNNNNPFINNFGNNNNMSNRFKNIVGQNFNRGNMNSQQNWNWLPSTNIDDQDYNNGNNQTNPFISYNNKQQAINTNNSINSNSNNNNNQTGQKKYSNNPFLQNNQSNTVKKIGGKKNQNDQFSNLIDFTKF